MDLLKDKKKLPIVAGIAAVVLLAMIGLILFELGVFPSGGEAPATTTTPVVAAPAPAPVVRTASAAQPLQTANVALVAQRAGGAKTAGASTQDPTVVNPMVGADPFALPAKGKTITRTAARQAGAVGGTRMPLGQVLSPYNLFAIHEPKSSAPPVIDLAEQPGADQMLADTRVSGIVNADDGIFAIVETNGNSQTVKPGDKLLDGSKVASIQPTGITLHTLSGGIISLPLSNGAPTPPPNTFGYGGGFGGYPGGGGGGFGGYPGGGGGGFGGYPGGGGGGFGGYPGGGGGGGGGYPGGGGGGYGGGGGGYPGGGGGGYGGDGGGGYPGG